MLKTETLSQTDKNDSENKQTEIINGKKIDNRRRSILKRD